MEGLDKATGNPALYWPCYGGHRGIAQVLLTQPDFGQNWQSKQAGRSSSARGCLEGFCRHCPLATGKSPSPMAFSYLAIHMPAMVKIEKPCQSNLTECSSSPAARTAESSRDTQPRGGSDLPLIQRF
ncbi:hypothetical protein ACRRTK_002042 [Alexandromys fortis]